MCCIMKAIRLFVLCLVLSSTRNTGLWAQAGPRVVSGLVLSEKNEAVSGAKVVAQGTFGVAQTISDRDGRFVLEAGTGSLRLEVSGNYIVPAQVLLSANEVATNLEIHVHYQIAPVHESLVITASALNPTLDQRNENVYKSTLFSRDDQIFDTLAAGINAGQHEGGGKSLEIRRFGFNLDHGGVNGGLKVLVDDVQQNQATQGHG
jgi:hypothetical protein